VANSSRAAPTLNPIRDAAGNLIVCHANGAGRHLATKQSNFRFSLDVHPLETLSFIIANVENIRHPSIFGDTTDNKWPSRYDRRKTSKWGNHWKQLRQA